MSMKFTLAGFEGFLNNADSSLFSDVPVPEGADVDIIKGVIIERYGEMETLYADPYKMKFSTLLFFKKHAKTFDKWFSAINLDYEPLYNYDRYEEWIDEGAGTKNANTSSINDSIESGNNSDSNTSTGSDTRTSQALASENTNEDINHVGSNTSNDSMVIDETTTENTISDKLASGNSERNTANDDKNKAAAYNSSTLPEAENSISTGFEGSANSSVENSTINGTSSRNGNNTSAKSGADAFDDTKNSATSKAENETTTDTSNTNSTINGAHSNVRNDNGTSNASESSATLGTHKGHLYGNIGVTTSSALLLEYIDASSWSFYDHVADLYAEELLLMIY